MTEPEPSDVEITYKGVPAISASLAAKRWRTSTDTMRKTIARLKAAGQLAALPEGLDERIELYRRDEIDLLVNARPGKGANLRNTEDRPMAKLTSAMHPAAAAARAQIEPSGWPADITERTVREVASELWRTRKEAGTAWRKAIRALAENAEARNAYAGALLASLRAQGAKEVTPLPIARAVQSAAQAMVEKETSK